MLFEDSMSIVDENADESDDPIALNESDEDEIKHDPLIEFHPNDEIPFSRLLSDSMVSRFKGLTMVMQIRTCHY